MVFLDMSGDLLSAEDAAHVEPQKHVLKKLWGVEDLGGG